jgi:AbrB family looped-hinge helix DNA binding protein
MRITIDAAGRLVVPKQVRDQLGLAPGTELELSAVDGRLEITVPSRVHVEDGPQGVRFVADGARPLSADQVRDVMEQVRR